jgi:hypothetical protein
VIFNKFNIYQLYNKKDELVYILQSYNPSKKVWEIELNKKRAEYNSLKGLSKKIIENSGKNLNGLKIYSGFSDEDRKIPAIEINNLEIEPKNGRFALPNRKIDKLSKRIKKDINKEREKFNKNYGIKFKS